MDMRRAYSVNPFHATGLFRYSPENRKSLVLGFLFSGVIERDQWHKMGFISRTQINIFLVSIF